MRTIQLEIEDNYFNNTLKLLNNLKALMTENITIKYNNLTKDEELKNFSILSNSSLENIWDNSEDAIYDKYLE